jgi:hypothetical protein
MTGNSNNSSINFIIPLINTNFGDIIKYSKLEYDIKMSVINYKTNHLDIQITDDYNMLFNNSNSDFFCVLEYDTDFNF